MIFAVTPPLTRPATVYDHDVQADDPFISYAQNREDVVLWRALGHLPTGRYVEVGANHPRDDSVTRAFYDRGWSGITVEPMHDFAEAHRSERPRDSLVEAVVTDQDVTEVILHEVAGTGLSSIVDAVGDQHRGSGATVVDVKVPATRLSTILTDHGGLDQEVHFFLVDTEGAEPQVLRSVDLTVFRPWVAVVEATAPNSPTATHAAWEHVLLDAGYQFCLFDGVSRFYVAEERADELAEALSRPASAHDRFVDARAHDVWLDRERLRSDLWRWRSLALAQWASPDDAGPGGSADRLRAERDAARFELEAMRRTLSWRVTRPIRLVRRWIGQA